MNIRKIEESDKKELLILRNSLWPESLQLNEKDLTDFFAGTSNTITEIFVATVDKNLIGFIEVNIRNYAKGSNEQAIPYIEGWYISPSHQRKGYGKELISFAESWAKTLGYKELASDAESTNTKSIAIHEYLGFKETGRIVSFLKEL